MEPPPLPLRFTLNQLNWMGQYFEADVADDVGNLKWDSPLMRLISAESHAAMCADSPAPDLVADLTREGHS